MSWQPWNLIANAFQGSSTFSDLLGSSCCILLSLYNPVSSDLPTFSSSYLPQLPNLVASSVLQQCVSFSKILAFFALLFILLASLPFLFNALSLRLDVLILCATSPFFIQRSFSILRPVSLFPRTTISIEIAILLPFYELQISFFPSQVVSTLIAFISIFARQLGTTYIDDKQ